MENKYVHKTRQAIYVYILIINLINTMLKNALALNMYPNRDISKEKHEEYQYLNLLNDILNEGYDLRGRNGMVKMV